MADTINKPSEIDTKAETVKPDDAELDAQAKAKAERADAAEAAYQKSEADKTAKASANAESAEAAYQSAVETWFHEAGRKLGYAFPVYSDYEEKSE